MIFSLLFKRLLAIILINESTRKTRLNTKQHNNMQCFPNQSFYDAEYLASRYILYVKIIFKIDHDSFHFNNSLSILDFQYTIQPGVTSIIPDIRF